MQNSTFPYLLLHDVFAPRVHRANDSIVYKFWSLRIWIQSVSLPLNLDIWALNIIASDLVTISHTFYADNFKEDFWDFLLLEFALLYLKN